MTADDLQARTRSFALRVIRLVNAMPSTLASQEIARQLLRSAMSVSANYRAARRARSRKEYVSKLSIVVEESDESEHWLDLLSASGIVPKPRITSLHQESGELMRIFAASRRTAILTKSRLRPITT